MAVIWLTTQPANEDAFEQSSVEPICFRAAMLARHGHARRVDDVGFDVAGPQPARKPKSVATGLECDGDARDHAAHFGCLRTPSHQQTKQLPLIRLKLLQRMALYTWNNAGDEPARLTHLDYGNQRVVWIEGGEGSAQVVHGALH